MPKNRTMLLTAAVMLICIGVYFCTFTGKNLDFVLPRRALKIWAMLVVSCATAYSTIVFQTISSNRILTPSIIGFDSFYILIQTVMVYMYGDKTYQTISHESNFILSVCIMVLFALLMYHFIFKRESTNIYVLMLAGLLLGTVFRSISSFIAVLLDPNEFMFVQASMFASFENIQVSLLGAGTALIAIAAAAGMRYFPSLDVMNLGRDNAVSLGVDYNRIVRISLMIVAVMSSVSTALVGPVTFLGLITANLSYEFFKGRPHRVQVLGCCLLTSVIVIAGQYLVEHLFNMSTTITIIVNLAGGIYFIYNLLKANKKS